MVRTRSSLLRPEGAQDAGNCCGYGRGGSCSGCHFGKTAGPSQRSIGCRADQRQSPGRVYFSHSSERPSIPSLSGTHKFQGIEFVGWLPTCGVIERPANKIALYNQFVHTVPILDEGHPVDECVRGPPPQLRESGAGAEPGKVCTISRKRGGRAFRVLRECKSPFRTHSRACNIEWLSLAP